MKNFLTTKVCSKEIGVKVEENVVKEIKFYGGCEGNTKAIEILLKDQKVEDVIKKLNGITCGKRGTSCPDQLAKILETHFTK